MSDSLIQWIITACILALVGAVCILGLRAAWRPVESSPTLYPAMDDLYHVAAAAWQESEVEG